MVLRNGLHPIVRVKDADDDYAVQLAATQQVRLQQ
jgi:hypothetical protein